MNINKDITRIFGFEKNKIIGENLKDKLMVKEI